MIFLLLFLLGLAMKLSKRAKYHIKYIAFHLYCIFLSLLCGFFCLFHKPGSSENLKIGQLFMRLIKFEWLFGLKIEIKGHENLLDSKRPFIVVSNHQTSIDALIMLKTSPNRTAPLAKKILLYVPIFGQVCWLCGTVFINRKHGKTAIEIMRKVGSKMKKKMTSLWIFPEGTRYQLDKVMPFKKGAFHLAVQAQVPLVPVVIGNYRNVLDRQNKRFDGGVIRVKCLPPIDTTGLTVDDVNEFTDKVFKIISEEFEKDYNDNLHLYPKNK